MISLSTADSAVILFSITSFVAFISLLIYFAMNDNSLFEKGKHPTAVTTLVVVIAIAFTGVLTFSAVVAGPQVVAAGIHVPSHIREQASMARDTLLAILNSQIGGIAIGLLIFASIVSEISLSIRNAGENGTDFFDYISNVVSKFVQFLVFALTLGLLLIVIFYIGIELGKKPEWRPTLEVVGIIAGGILATITAILIVYKILKSEKAQVTVLLTSGVGIAFSVAGLRYWGWSNLPLVVSVAPWIIILGYYWLEGLANPSNHYPKSTSDSKPSDPWIQQSNGDWKRQSEVIRETKRIKYERILLTSLQTGRSVTVTYYSSRYKGRVLKMDGYGIFMENGGHWFGYENINDVEIS